MPPYGPHSFRKTLSRYGQQQCKTVEQFKVWSQVTGHEDVLTTLRSYGEVSFEREQEVIAAMRTSVPTAGD